MKTGKCTLIVNTILLSACLIKPVIADQAHPGFNLTTNFELDTSQGASYSAINRDLQIEQAPEQNTFTASSVFVEPLFNFFGQAEQTVSAATSSVKSFISTKFNAIREHCFTQKQLTFTPQTIDLAPYDDNENSLSSSVYTKLSVFNIESNNKYKTNFVALSSDLEHEFKIDFANSQNNGVFGSSINVLYDFEQHEDEHIQTSALKDEIEFEIGFSSSI